MSHSKYGENEEEGKSESGEIYLQKLRIYLWPTSTIKLWLRRVQCATASRKFDSKIDFVARVGRDSPGILHKQFVSIN